MSTIKVKQYESVSVHAIMAEVWLYFLTSASDGNEWSTLRLDTFTPGKKPSTPTKREDGWAQSRFG
jgi:hypothetical protein